MAIFRRETSRGCHTQVVEQECGLAMGIRVNQGRAARIWLFQGTGSIAFCPPCLAPEITTIRLSLTITRQGPKAGEPTFPDRGRALSLFAHLWRRTVTAFESTHLCNTRLSCAKRCTQAPDCYLCIGLARDERNPSRLIGALLNLRFIRIG